MRSSVRANLPSQAPAHQAVALSSDDGALLFDLRRCETGVLMKRTRHRMRQGRVVQEIHLAEEAHLVRWCEHDQLRFAYPLLFVTLRRSGSALFHLSDPDALP